MLSPHSRRILLEALRPPEGYSVDTAVATTYSLDLIALLMAPLAFSLFDRLASRDKAQPLDGLAILQAVREHADKLTVFCDAGRIAFKAGKYRQLLTYLEDAVVPVTVPSDEGVLHAKLWVLRFVARDPQEPIRYRVIVPTRNLTLDQSWDTLLVLEGELTDRTRAIADNHPLGELLDALPTWARRLPRARRKAVETVAYEIRRVRFAPPDGFQDEVRFWTFGLEGKAPDPFDTRIERLLVVSPFLTASELQHLTQSGSEHVLVSRPEEIDKIGAKGVAGFSEVLVLQDGADDAGVEGDDAETTGFSPGKGLHAKLYVADAGRNAKLWTGSANATHAAFHHNVEILVELTGPKGRCGVDAILASDEQPNLRAVLAPYSVPPDPVVDLVQERLEKRLEQAQRRVAAARWAGVVTQAAGGGGDAATFDVEIRCAGKLVLPEGVEVTCWPIALPQARAAALTPPFVARFEACSFGALTTFYAFHLRVTEGVGEIDKTFVVPIPLEGLPQERAARVLESLLDEPSKLMRFLRFLLATDSVALGELLEEEHTRAQAPSREATRHGDFDGPLLEMLLRNLRSAPERLDAIERLVKDLRTSERGRALLPADFDRIWEPLQVARTQTGRRS